MTHVLTYMSNRYTDEQVKEFIGKQKEVLFQAFSLKADACTAAVRRMDATDVCANTADAVVMVIYTGAGKGAEVKRRLVKGLTAAATEVLGVTDTAKIVCVIKEQMSDMIGVNGLLRCNAVEACSAYETK